MNALAKALPHGQIVLGPYEKVVSRLTTRHVAILRPPPGASVQRMLRSVQWIGMRWGDLALAEHLLSYPKLIDRMAAKAGCPFGPPWRLDFPGAMRTRTVADGDGLPRIFPEHAVLERQHAGWELKWDTFSFTNYVVAYTKPPR